MSFAKTRPPLPLFWWVLFCVYCNCAGWFLSALGELNAHGYWVVLGLGFCILVALAVRNPQMLTFRLPAGKWRRRYKRPFPAAFVVLASLAILGGFLYAPTNYDALAYRIPRVLNWLAEGHWHWIHTEFNRLNTRAFGFEWVAAPIIALTGTDRFLFLINVVSFLLLPGLVFGVFTRLGIRPRVAWHWMWLVPTGYCFLLQAGGIGNDLFGAVFALAAVNFALRARQSKRITDVWLSILAAALMTGAKASNLPLLLPWLIALVPSLKLLLPRPAPSLAILVAAAPASLLPLIGINLKYSGDWSGIAAERVQALEHGSLLKAANNSVLLSVQNLAPPIFPMASQWSRAVPRHMPAGLRTRLEKAFEPGGAHWLLGEMQIEETAGLGFGVTLLLLLGLGFGLFVGNRSCSTASRMPLGGFSLAVIGGAFAALLAFMVESGLTAAARLVTPYYALLIPAALASGAQVRLIRARWWRAAAMAVFAMAGLLVIISPSRPLWPANAFLNNAAGANSLLLARARTVYSVFSQRADGFAPVRKLLPADAVLLGLVTADDPETSLWRPFGQRRVVHVTHTDSSQDLRARKIQYVLVSSKKLESFFHKSLEQWRAEIDAEVLSQVTLPLRVTDGPSDWFLLKLR